MFPRNIENVKRVFLTGKRINGDVNNALLSSLILLTSSFVHFQPKIKQLILIRRSLFDIIREFGYRTSRVIVPKLTFVANENANLNMNLKRGIILPLNVLISDQFYNGTLKRFCVTFFNY